MTTPPYIPEPGSLPARVLDLFSRNVDEYFTSSDLALKFQAPANSMKARLEAPLHYGLLRFEKESSEDKPAWCVGPKFAAWRAQQLAANPKPAAAPQPARHDARGFVRADVDRSRRPAGQCVGVDGGCIRQGPRLSLAQRRELV